MKWGALRPPGLPPSPSPPALPSPARRGPSSKPGRRLPLPSSSPSHPALQLLPTDHSARSEWRRRTREASSARARGGRRRAGGGAAASARARAAPVLSARAKLRSARLLCAQRLGMLGGLAPAAPGPPRALCPQSREPHLYPGPFSSSTPIVRSFARSRRFVMTGCWNGSILLPLLIPWVTALQSAGSWAGGGGVVLKG